MLSKCPNCRSTFEIIENQLNAANGLVRCGSCLHVFNGQEESTQALHPVSTKDTTHFSTIDQELEAIEAEINAIAEKREAPKISQSIDDDLLNFDAITKAFKSEKTTPSMFDTLDSGLNTSDPANTEIETKPATPIDTQENKPEHFTATHDYLEPGWERSAADRSSVTAQGLKRRSKLEEDIDNFFAVSDTIQHHGSGADQYQKGHLRPKESQGFSQPQKTSIDTLHIHDEPLNLNSEETPAAPLPIVKIAAALIVMLCLGSTAYGISQFETLSQDPVWRPRLAAMCNILHCTLPVTYSTRYIKLTQSNMVAVEDQLEVNAVIFNTNAHFEMPFPDVVVLFFDLDQKLIAELDIRPDEYRQGEIARMKKLPTNTSAHIAFVLKDPTDGTLNYEIQFRYPDDLDKLL